MDFIVQVSRQVSSSLCGFSVVSSFGRMQCDSIGLVQCLGSYCVASVRLRLCMRYLSLYISIPLYLYIHQAISISLCISSVLSLASLLSLSLSLCSCLPPVSLACLAPTPCSFVLRTLSPCFVWSIPTSSLLPLSHPIVRPVGRSHSAMCLM